MFDAYMYDQHKYLKIKRFIVDAPRKKGIWVGMEAKPVCAVIRPIPPRFDGAHYSINKIIQSIKG